jgi:phage portal protein BeeE
MKIVLSTLTSAQNVVITEKASNGALRIVKRIYLNGGANAIDKKTLVTPQGVVTELDDKDFELLKKTEFYKRQEKAGFLRVVEKKDEAEDPKKAGLKKGDKSKQKTEEDIKETGATPTKGDAE